MQTTTQKIRFGPAGIPIGCDGDTLDGVRFTCEKGLGAMEIEFVRGVKISWENAADVGRTAKELNISLSAHCPYWINCCALEKQKIQNSIRNLLDTARAAQLLGARIIVFHPGFYMGRAPSVCSSQVKETLSQALEKMKQENLDVVLGAETTGKVSQFGTLEELIPICQELEGVAPVIDFAHIHARGNGCLRNKEDFKKIFDEYERLGLPTFHSHFAEINYSRKGELNHLELGRDEPPFEPLAEVLVENGYSGTIISESPILEADALKMQETYLRVLQKK